MSRSEKQGLRKGSLAIKRLFDLFAVLVCIPILLIATGVLSILILLLDGRPIFFVQTRSGRAGTPFRMVKFRSMQSIPHDPSNPLSVVTRSGRFLRRWGLDELPQWLNVLRGEMSLVGPRPMLPAQTERFGPFERQRLLVPPGLTGWAQINGRNALPWPERIRLDVWYVTHRSLWLDLYILFRTPLVIISGRGVYGSEGYNPDFRPETSDSSPDAPPTLSSFNEAV